MNEPPYCRMRHESLTFGIPRIVRTVSRAQPLVNQPHGSVPRMTDHPPDEASDAPYDDELGSVRRSYVALAFAAILVAALVWLVNAMKENNRVVECMAAGHHDCVPLDTSAKGPSR